jgi:death on curing protein
LNISQSEPLWLELDDVLDIHSEQIKLYGGPSGIIDENLVASALGRIKHHYYLNGERDLITLAVRLGVGIAANHGFADGNKRTGASAMIEFMAINGALLVLPNTTTLGRIFKSVVAKRRDERELIEFVAANVRLASQ